eukprot:UN27387
MEKHILQCISVLIVFLLKCKYNEILLKKTPLFVRLINGSILETLNTFFIKWFQNGESSLKKLLLASKLNLNKISNEETSSLYLDPESYLSKISTGTHLAILHDQTRRNEDTVDRNSENCVMLSLKYLVDNGLFITGLNNTLDSSHSARFIQNLTKKIESKNEFSTNSLIWNVIVFYLQKHGITKKFLESELKKVVVDSTIVYPKPTVKLLIPNQKGMNEMLTLVLHLIFALGQTYNKYIFNLGESLHDGMVLCFIVQHYLPGMLNRNKIIHIFDSGDKHGILNNRKLYKTCLEQVGCIPMLEEFDSIEPFNEKIIGLHLIYVFHRVLSIKKHN